MQSRYYDPQIGRFINADAYTSTGQGVLSNNMFAYCGNNPVSRLDPYGQSWWGDFWREIKDWVEDEKEKASKNEDGTKTTGINLSGAFGAGGAVSGGITSDRKGNWGFVFTVAGGGGMPSWGLCAYSTTTNAPTIYNQGGLGTQVGGSFSAIISIGAEYTMLIDTEADQAYHGYTVMAGIGAAAIPAEAHGEVGYSWVLGFNVYDAALVVINWISPEE